MKGVSQSEGDRCIPKATGVSLRATDVCPSVTDVSPMVTDVSHRATHVPDVPNRCVPFLKMCLSQRVTDVCRAICCRKRVYLRSQCRVY